MVSVVVNRRYGGFGLSDEAIRLYAEKKGITLYAEEGEFGYLHLYTVPVEKYRELSTAYKALRSQYEWNDPRVQEALEQVNDAYFSGRGIKRDDPALVEVVRELGEKADGACANLEIVEIPDDVKWTIEEYDGDEWVAEQHRTW